MEIRVVEKLLDLGAVDVQVALVVVVEWFLVGVLAVAN